jgi:hypothetical protein
VKVLYQVLDEIYQDFLLKDSVFSLEKLYFKPNRVSILSHFKSDFSFHKLDYIPTLDGEKERQNKAESYHDTDAHTDDLKYFDRNVKHFQDMYSLNKKEIVKVPIFFCYQFES